MTAPALSARGIHKSFAGVRALSGVDLTIMPGEVHALLGENGAGKSTLIKILAGIHRLDAGAIEIGGTPLPQGFSPADVAKAGLRFVHQDLGLVDTLSILENMAFVTGFAKRRGLIDYRASAAVARRRLEAMALDVAPETLVGDLPHAEKAIVALARATEGEAKVIILDELTAALPSPDAARVHKSIRAARAEGIAFIYVSHRLEEVFGLCDRMTVLRDGKTIATSPVAEADLGQVIEWIAGKPHSPAKAGRPQAAAAAPRRLAGRGLAGGPIAEPVSLDVGRGDIVGLTGIIGSGYDRICEWLGGLATPEAGTVEVDGGPVPIGSVGRMRAAGIDVIAGDRSRGAFFDLKVRENLFADGIYRREQRMGLGEERSRAEALLDDFGVRPTNASELPIHALSGGNQQKVLFARAIMGDPKVLILIDPTAGVDIGARAELHRLLREAAGRGTAILLGSSDFEEIAAVSTRALVVRDGGIGAELTGDEITWDRLFAEAHGGHAIGAAGHGAEART